MITLSQTQNLRSRVYLDHNATTPPSQLVLDRAKEILTIWGNPSSIHESGREPKRILRETRQQVAKRLGCHPLEIVFNSGGSEGNVTILRGVLSQSQRKKIVLSAVEHPSVFKTAMDLQNEGIKVELIPVHRDGTLDMKEALRLIDSETALVSVMLANNEFGTIFPIQELSQIAHSRGALMHSDCVQGLGKIAVDLSQLDVDFATFSAHKFYSLKGTGFVYIRRNSPFKALVTGGGQERGRRAGTENIFGIASLGVNLPCLDTLEEESLRVQKIRDEFENEVLAKIPRVSITARESSRVPNTSSLVISEVDGEVLLMSLDVKGYCVSTGAACSSGNPEPSPALLAMGLNAQEAQSSLRVSFGRQNSREEMLTFVEVLSQVVQHLRKIQKGSSEVEGNKNEF